MSLEQPDDRLVVPTINTDSAGHICIPLYNGQCWCMPRTTAQIIIAAARSRGITLTEAAALAGVEVGELIRG